MRGSVGGPFRLQRLNVKDFRLKEDLLEFVDGLVAHLSFEAVTSARAWEAANAIIVEEGDFTHSLCMEEDGLFKASKLETRHEHAIDACTLHNQEWRYPCDEKMCLTLKHARSSSGPSAWRLWTGIRWNMVV